jgi:hypothetical protein
MVERYREQLHQFMGAFGSVVLCTIIFLFAHLVACLWYYVGTIEQLPDPVAGTPLQIGWVEREWGVGGLPDGVDECAVLQDVGKLAARRQERVQLNCTAPSQSARYLTSVYWALMTISTVGYGDIVATTNLEKVWALCSMLFGALIFAMITGSISARMTAGKGGISHYNTKMDEVRQYLADTNIDIGTRRRIEAYHRDLWESKSIYGKCSARSCHGTWQSCLVIC